MKVAPFVQHDVQVFGLVVIVLLFAIVIVGTVLGRRYRVGPPVLLIGLGALLGLVPQFGHVRLDGEIVLLLFLPAILYWESLNTSFREIRANLARREIRVMFEELHGEIPDVVATGEPARLLSPFIHGIKTLPIAWTPPG